MLIQKELPARQQTVLFIDGYPVGYSIYKNENVFSLAPSENPNEELIAPELTAIQETKNSYTITGTNDQNLIDQVVEDLDYFLKRVANF